jgi:23S rRNA pseudouridine1911/1915/1917 synthase
MVLAKSTQAADGLRAMFRSRLIERMYVAVVAGTLKANSGRFESFLATAKNLDRFSTTERDAGQRAITHYRLLRQYPNCAVVEVKLETGRRNQIRVHFAEAGHPVLGDPRYGRGQPARSDWNESRLALHAVHLALRHPIHGSSLRFDSPLPKPMRRFLSHWQLGLPGPTPNEHEIDGRSD